MGLGGGGDGWDHAAGDAAAAATGMAPDNTFLRWIIGGEDGAGVMDTPVLEQMMSPPSNAAFGHNLSPSSFAAAAAMEDTKPAEALRFALSPTGDSPSPPASTPYDVVLKLGAYKTFSEISPFLQFQHLTCVQAILDELAGATSSSCIHVIDFDIGMGEQWASLMQELASHRRAGAGVTPAPALKVTALVSPASHHPLELQLIHENLSSFAAELGVFFQFAVYNIDTLDPSELLSIAGAGGEAVAVHLPVGAAHAATLPAILRLVKRLGAKVVVAVDRGVDRPDMPLAAHILNSLHSSVFLLDSIDAVGIDADTATKIERFLIHPSIEQSVVARHRGGGAGVTWRGVFAAAGFVAATATTFAESQAESLVSKAHVRGFRVEKRGGALCLYWQRGELVSVSAWRC
uniref:Uncharacterized protein n=1 Tax=Leersia perrieri TaxID=77586 RepID=A0A0D9XM82_9ORYZ